MLTLDVAICTHSPDGIKRVDKMLSSHPPRGDVRYIVSWQGHENSPVPESLSQRPDVEIYRLDIKGLSNNRNNAIRHCKGDIIYIADDDLDLYPDFADIIIKPFKEDKSLDLALFKVNYLNKKVYPQNKCEIKLPLPKNYYVTSFEIAFRKENLGDLRFYPELGLGSPRMACGEEELFLFSAIKRGKKCMFYPEEICSHPAATTGDFCREDILRGQGYVISVMYPVSFILRVPLKAYRIAKKHNKNFFKSFYQLMEGALYAKTTFSKIDKRYRW